MALLMRQYAPVVTVDAHEYTVVGRYLEKFGTVQRFDALLQYATTANVPEFVTKAAEEWFRRPAVTKLRDAGLTSEWYYTTTTDIADKKISMGGTQPDTGRNVNGLTNAISILIETRGVGIGRLHLKRRVHSHVVAISSTGRTGDPRGRSCQAAPVRRQRGSARPAARSRDRGRSERQAIPAADVDPVTGEDSRASPGFGTDPAALKLRARRAATGLPSRGRCGSSICARSVEVLRIRARRRV